MKLAMQYRVSVAVNGMIDLEVKTLGGGTETIRFPARSATQMAKHLRDFSAATALKSTEWIPSHYQAEPGPNGGWQIGLTTEGKIGILLKVPGGIALEMELPATDVATLIEQLQVALQGLSGKQPIN